VNPTGTTRLRRVTSHQNAAVKKLRRAFARGELTEDGLCAIEGIRTLDEAIRSGLKLQSVFFAESASELAARLLPQIGAHTETLLLPDNGFHAAVATENPQGVAALVKLKEFDIEDALRGAEPFVALVVGLQDPGNLGTILRSAEAFGAGGVLLAEKTVSPFNPKVVRASAGSFFRLPVLTVKLADAVAKLRERGLRLVASSSHKGTPAAGATLSGALALLIGNEGAGLPREAMAAVEETVVIPHSAKVESLNAGIAASILLYEAARQRALAAQEHA
jgi:TrmH family RNA methyltransferase